MSFARDKPSTPPNAQKGPAKRRANGCRWCGGSGWVEAYQRLNLRFDSYAFAFICRECSAAQEIGITGLHGGTDWRHELLATHIPRLSDNIAELAEAMGPLPESYLARKVRERDERAALQPRPEMVQAAPSISHQETIPLEAPF